MPIWMGKHKDEMFIAWATIGGHGGDGPPILEEHETNLPMRCEFEVIVIQLQMMRHLVWDCSRLLHLLLAIRVSELDSSMWIHCIGDHPLEFVGCIRVP